MQLGIEIINEILDRLSWPQMTTLEDEENRTAQQRKILRLFNRVLRTLQGSKDWPMFRADAHLTLVACRTAESTEYLVATQGSADVELTGVTDLDASYVGRVFKAGADEYTYTITAVAGVDTLTLHAPWVSDDVAAGDEILWTIAADRYVLPTNFDRPTGDIDAFLMPYGVSPVTPEEFKRLRRQRLGKALDVGQPRWYTIYGLNESQTAQLIHFHPYPEEAQILPYTYQIVHHTINTDNDKVLFPPRYMEALIDLTLQLAMRDYEDDARSQEFIIDYIRNYNAQAANPGVVEGRLNIGISGSHRLRENRKWASRGLRVDWGSAFDDINNIGFP